MAQLDVSEAINTPEFSDEYKVIRRRESVNIHGRASDQQTLHTMFAVITAGPSNDVERLEDGQRARKTITVVTNFRLRGPAEVKGTKWRPDAVPYHGDIFQVMRIDDYTAFGPGFVQAELETIDIIQSPPPEGTSALGQQARFIFASPGNSWLVGVL